MIDKIDCEYLTQKEGEAVWSKGYYLYSVAADRTVYALVICRTSGALLSLYTHNVRFPQFAVQPK